MKLLALVFTLVVALASVVTAQTIEPWAMNNKAIGGSALNQYTPGVENGKGPNNIGLLIKSWGKVTKVDDVNKFFYIDDGSGLLDGYGPDYVGIRVSYDNLAPSNTITPPSEGSYVMITGISSTVVINTKIHPNLRPRKQADIQQVLM